MKIKKLLLISMALLSGAMSASALADTGYDFSANFQGGSADALYAGTVWVDGGGVVTNFTNLSVGGTSMQGNWDGIGYVNPWAPNGGTLTIPTPINSSPSIYSFGFTFNTGDSGAFMSNVSLASYSVSQDNNTAGNVSYIIPTGTNPPDVAPEMNASLIPQVGLLLGCLFFLFGRKKETNHTILDWSGSCK